MNELSPTQPMEREAAAQLAEAARQQQPGARESLLQQLYPMLAAVVHQYPKVFPSREDALQEGRLIILEALYSYRPELSVPFLAYVRQRLWYHFMNQARRKQPLPILDSAGGVTGGGSGRGAESGDDREESWLARLPDEGPLPEETLLNDELHQWLAEAVANLGEEDRLLFQEHYGKQKTLRQLAAEIGRHPVTLSRQKAAMLTRLRQQLQPRGSR